MIQVYKCSVSPRGAACQPRFFRCHQTHFVSIHQRRQNPLLLQRLQAQEAIRYDAESTDRYTYDHDGMRTRKQTESGRTDYYWSGKRLLELKVGDDLLHMYYDAAGKPAAVSYGNSRYRYVYNLQGDVVALVDAGQTAVVEYRYDAWGKLLATTGSMAGTLGKLNPFRYRGYIYDEETGLYWLRSRYYNPEWKRFLNADSVAYLGADGGLLSYNLFAYCGNNPVVRTDEGGTVWFVSILVGLATRYVGDIIENLADGKTGGDIFKPTSTVGEYVAAGVTALIPGSGLAANLTRNIVAEGITVAEKAITGEKVVAADSIVNIGIGTFLDAGFERASYNACHFIDTKAPRNYSSYAYTVRKSKPTMSREQLLLRMQRSIRLNTYLQKITATSFDIVRTTLPY